VPALTPTVAIGGAGALGLLLLAVRRPAVACAVLAAAIPLTAGMARGAAVPLLRVNEALLLVVVAGFLLHWLARRRPLAFTGLDVVVLGFCLVSVAIPWAVILLSHAQADQSDWLLILGPIQYLLVFLLFSRTEFGAADLRLFFNVCMLASIPVAAVAVAQSLDLGPTRDLVNGYYPTAPLPSWDTTYRPSSLLGHYSALGAFGLLNFLIALALSATRHPGFRSWWLALVMGANLVSVVVSQTYAPAVGLVAGVALVLLGARRIPWRQAAAAPPVLAAAGILFWPSITARIASQLSVPAGSSLPDSLQTRVDYWQGFFVPALLRHGPWLGTGTLMPPEVPRPLVDFVDNGYLYQLFRAGVPGLLALVAMLGAVAAAGWAARRSDDHSRRVVGLVCAGAVASVLLMDATSEYLTFTAVSQEFWMLVGLLAGFAVAGRLPGPARLVEILPTRGGPRRPAPTTPGAGAVTTLVRRLVAPGSLLRSSALLTAGNASARFLSLLFSVAAARFLEPAGYGVLAYALVVANVGSILIVNAPLGLTRFLSLHRDEPGERDAYFSNWMPVISGITAASLVLMVPVAMVSGLGGWLLPALLANLVGTAVLETYLQVECGLERFALMVGFWAVANLLQLVAALAAGLAGYRSPAVFLAIYGLSSVAALAVLLPLAPLPLRFRSGALSWRRVRDVARYTAPLVLMNAFTTVWLGADVVLVERLVSPAAAGRYAAAKIVVNGFAIVSWAISSAVMPRASRLTGQALRAQLLRALGLTAAAVVPLLLVLSAIALPLLRLVFGQHYADAGTPLTLLAAAMAVYAFYSVIESVWLGLGRPNVVAAASGAGMIGVIAAGLLLVPALGASGAALAFGIGSAAQLAVLAALTVRSPQLGMGHRGPAKPGHGAEVGRARRAEPEPEARPLLVVAEALRPTQDGAYERFVRGIAAGLGARRPTELHDLRVAAVAKLRRSRPAAVVYASRAAVTVPALLRARLLMHVCGAPVALAGLQGAGRRSPGRLALRLLGPDLLLVPTDRERDAGRAAGVLTETVRGGVDLDRFRPPRRGERARLRRRWGLPARDRIVLHVGQLRDGGSLQALMPLAGEAGVTMVVAAGDLGGSASERLRRELEAAGVVAVDGDRPDVDELYRLANCCAFPTVSPEDAEPLPPSVLEAMASDLPVVTTRFGALAERFGGAPGLTLADRMADIPSLALAACGSPAGTRRLAEPYAWDALAGRLAAAVSEVERDHRARGATRGVLAARVERLARDWRGLPRRVVWGGRPGYRAQRTATAAIAPANEPAPAPSTPAAPRTTTIGLLAPRGRPPQVVPAAGLLGLTMERAGDGGAERLIDRAIVGGWDLVAAPAEALEELSRCAGALGAYVGRGGTLVVDGLDARSDPALRRLGEDLGEPLPAVARAPAGAGLLVPAEQAAFGGVLAGTALESGCGEHVLEPCDHRDALAWALAGGVRRPVVIERRAGRGRIVLSTLPRAGAGAPAEVLSSDRAAALVVPLLMLRQVYGSAAWHAPRPVANFTIDDPALRQGPLGLRYDLLAAQARDHGFHVTIATVPRELPLADDVAVRRLRQHPELLSACYHGCDHDGYEFYLPAGRRTRYQPRPLGEQRDALRRAVERGHRFASATGCRLDRVMVFPYGVGPASLFPDLRRLGFLATCNYWDKYPLGAAVPHRPYLGVRPADLAWEGYPLLWRRDTGDQGFLLDMLLGRPSLTFAHRRGLGSDFGPFVERARAINQAGHGAVAWCGLEEVARHSHLQRRVPDGGWEVLMTGDEACLHNPDSAPRSYRVTRPELPAGARLEAVGACGTGPLGVTVPAGGRCVVRVAGGGAAPPLGAGPRHCSISP
jgi:O-antigen/teichoic acid export membrane protein/glycosyltransferase involved in cell wall biosynthesis